MNDVVHETRKDMHKDSLGLWHFASKPYHLRKTRAGLGGWQRYRIVTLGKLMTPH
jgi:hypothetical protein